MKILKPSAIAAFSVTCAVSAHAQGSVTLYGMLDDGIAYFHNVGGQSSQWHMNSGGLSGTAWGLTGTEDLGGGLGTVFKLENNFSLANGTLAGGREFGAKAFVGLTDRALGSITLGRQNEPMSNLIAPITGDSYSATFATPGDADNYDGSMKFDNAIEWTSPLMKGLSLQIMYAVGGVAGSVGSGQSYAAAGIYTSGPISVAAGFLHVDNGNTQLSARGTTTGASVFNSAINSAYASSRSINIERLNGQYVFGSVTVGTGISFSQYNPDASSSFATAEKYFNGSIFANWRVNPAFSAVAGYNYTKTSGDSSAQYHQVNLGIDYLLSKRTDLYATAAYQHASGQNGLGAAQAVIGSYDVNSDASSQIFAIIGMRHRF